MILGSNNEKMSKSKGNVINPDDVVKEYGADTLRVYEMFMGDYQQDVSWSTESLRGCNRFVNRVIKIGEKLNDKEGYQNPSSIHKTIKKVSDDLVTLKFNTAVSALMILLNEMEKYPNGITKDEYRVFLTLLNPIAPHITEELNEQYSLGKPLCESSWPIYDENLIKDTEKTIGIQVNGKLRGEVAVCEDDTTDTVKEKVEKIENMQKYLQDKEIVKFIYVTNKIVSIIVK